MTIAASDLRSLAEGFDRAPERSYSLPARCYTEAGYLEVEKDAIFKRSWQFVCHVEQLRQAGDYLAFALAGQSLFAVRDGEGRLRAFYNVCQHRAHELLRGAGNTKAIVCPYHAWSYHLDGRLRKARRAEFIEGFNADQVCLMPVRIEEFCSLVFVNLDPDAAPLAEHSGDLGTEIALWAPDMAALTHAHRKTYHIKANWKSVIDNFLECYHCPLAHNGFAELFDMDSYKVTTHGSYSSHMAVARQAENPCYDNRGAEVQDHAVWWLWPNICLLRYPGAGNIMVLNVVPTGPDSTFETYDFFFEQATPNDMQREAIDYIDNVLQREDIDIVESVQRGMSTPAFDRGRFVADPAGSGLSEHAVHHFHGLVLEALQRHAGAPDG